MIVPQGSLCADQTGQFSPRPPDFRGYRRLQSLILLNGLAELPGRGSVIRLTGRVELVNKMVVAFLSAGPSSS